MRVNETMNGQAQRMDTFHISGRIQSLFIGFTVWLTVHSPASLPYLFICFVKVLRDELILDIGFLL